MPGDRRVSLTESTASRMAAATLAYEASGRNMSPIKFRQVSDDSPGIRLGTIDTTWTKNTTATVTDLNGDGTPKDPAETFEAKNYFATVTVSGSGTKKVACALVDSTWILIAAECD